MVCCHAEAAPRRAITWATATTTAAVAVHAMARPHDTRGPAGSSGGSSPEKYLQAATAARSAIGAAAALAATEKSTHF